MDPDRIYNILSDSRLVSEGTGLASNFTQAIRWVYSRSRCMDDLVLEGDGL